MMHRLAITLAALLLTAGPAYGQSDGSDNEKDDTKAEAAAAEQANESDVHEDGETADVEPLPKRELKPAEMQGLLEELDARQRSSGDFKALVYIDNREKNKSDLLYEAVVYRRDTADKLVILFTKPKSERGKGYLRIENNLFLYDPNVGRWERRTERERIGGTSSQRRDFDASRLAEQYEPSWVGLEELGKYDVHRLKLKVKDEHKNNVAYPVMEIWVDVDSHNILKVQEFALSGRLMRTTYYPKWERAYSESKGEYVYYPKEIRVYDEVEEGNRTIVLFRAVELKPLPDNIFTKAWVESKSR